VALPPPPGSARITEGPGAGALVAPMTANGVPVAPPQPVDSGIGAIPVRRPGTGPGVVAPQEPGRARRVVEKSPPSRELQEGDLVCGACGEANLPTRKFCSRCGNELNDAEVVKAAWWRRLLPKRKPRKARAVDPNDTTPKTGERRQHRRSILPAVRRTIAVLLILGGVLYAAVPGLRGEINTQAVTARARVEKMIFGVYVPVRAVTAVSKPVVKGHGADAAVDTHTNTYWLTPANGPKRLTITFAEPVALTKTIIHGGIAADMRASLRPKILHFVYPTGKGQDIPLVDTADQQAFDLDTGGKITSLDIYISDIYPNEDSKNIALSEVEFWKTEH
jgi:hypothetical protein